MQIGSLVVHLGLCKHNQHNMEPLMLKGWLWGIALESRISLPSPAALAVGCQLM